MKKILKYVSIILLSINNKSNSNEKIKESLINSFKKNPQTISFYELNFSDSDNQHPTSIAYLAIKNEIKNSSNISVLEYFTQYKNNNNLSHQMNQLDLE
jgi:hypothetical protein